MVGGRVTTNFGWVDVVPLLGAIAGCHCSVLWLSGGGAIAGCHCGVRWLWGEGDDQLWGEWTWWHCRVLWLGGVTANFGGVDVVPLQGAIVVCYGWGRVTTNFGGVDVVPLQCAIAVCFGSGGGWRPTLEEWTWCHCFIAGCRCSVLWCGGVDVVPLLGAVVVCYGGGDDQLWGSGRGAFDNTKISFCYLGSMLV